MHIKQLFLISLLINAKFIQCDLDLDL